VERRSTGALGEKLARNFLKKKGYGLVESNYRCREGEIDIIACQKDYLVFVEVRTRSNLKFGSPEESITGAKAEHLKKAALYYCQTHDKMSAPWRIDLVAVELDSANKLKRIELIQDAIEE